MSRRYTVICHRCGKSTFVDLSKTVSDQRCRSCRGFLQGVDVSVGDKPEYHRKLVVKMAGAAGKEPVWRDQETPVIPVRQRWPRYYKWVVAGGVAAFLAAIGRVGFVKFRDSAGGHREISVQEEPPPPDVRETPEWRKKATALARDALAATTVEELLPFLYHPEVDREVIRRYYSTEEQLPLGTDLVAEYFIPAGEYTENVVAFSFMDGAKRPRALVVVEKPGGMKIDWPSLVGLGEMSVKDYVRTAPEIVVVMRARARIGHYYNDYFADSKKWLSIRLSDVTDENVIHGYYDRAWPGASEMAQSFADPESDRERPDEPVIVVLKHPAGNVRSEQTQIVGLISTTWYLQEGLKPHVEQARKLDAARTKKPVEEQKPEAPPPEVPPENNDSSGPAKPSAPAKAEEEARPPGTFAFRQLTPAMKAGFLDKLLTKLDRVPPGEMQAFIMRLVQEKGFFEQVFEVLEEGVIICEPQGVITFINRAACRFFGLDAADAAGKPLEEAVRGFHWPARSHRRDSSVSRDMEVFYPEHRVLNFYLRPIDDGETDGPDVGYVMIVRDITQTRRMAEEQIETERLNAFTMMAAGVAHEIGNPLNSLNIHLQLLERKLKKADAVLYGTVRDQFNVARGEIQRLDFIIEQFLRAIRPSKPVFEMADLNKIIESAVNFLAPELKDRRIATRLQLHDSLPLLRLDAGQLKQAFYNLIKNALQAMGTGGSLTIRSDLLEYDAVVSFEDTGRGMSPETVAAMHDAWFTTRESGVGLGMLIVRRIVREHGGALSIESSEGKGTRVTITLPRGPRPVRFLPSGDPDERRKSAEPEVIDV